MQNYSSNLFIDSLVQGKNEWQNIPLVVRLTIKGLHDVLVRQEGEILRLKKAAESRQDEKPKQPTGLSPASYYDLPFLKQTDFLSYSKRVENEFEQMRTTQFQKFEDEVKNLKMKQYKIENSLRKKSDKLDVMNWMKTKVDLKDHEVQLQQMGLETLATLKDRIRISETEVKTELLSTLQKLKQAILQVREDCSQEAKFELFRGKEYMAMRKKINALGQELGLLRTELEKKVEVREISGLINSQNKNTTKEILQRVNTMWLIQQKNFQERENIFDNNTKNVENSIAFHKKTLDDYKTALDERLRSKVDTITVNSWIQKHTTELNEILAQIKDVQLLDLRKKLHAKASTEDFRGLIVEQEKLRNTLLQTLEGFKKAHELDAVRARGLTVQKSDYLGDLKQLKDVCMEYTDGAEKRIVAGVGEVYVTKSETSEYFEKKLEKLKRSIQTLHRSITQLLILQNGSQSLGSSLSTSTFQGMGAGMNTSSILANTSMLQRKVSSHVRKAEKRKKKKKKKKRTKKKKKFVEIEATYSEGEGTDDTDDDEGDDSNEEDDIGTTAIRNQLSDLSLIE